MSFDNPLDSLLKRRGLKVEDLNQEEALYYERAALAISKEPPTIPEQVNLINDHIEDLILQLCNVETSGKNCWLDANLKARIKNLLEMKATLTPGERARRYYEKVQAAER